MNIREAILKAADHIEANPSLFGFFVMRLPTDCGTPGCALGWIGHFLGAQYKDPYEAIYSSVPLSIGCRSAGWDHAGVLYGRMTEIEEGWETNARKCAKALRAYADRFHPEESKALVVYRPGADIVREMVGVAA